LPGFAAICSESAPNAVKSGRFLSRSEQRFPSLAFGDHGAPLPGWPPFFSDPCRPFHAWAQQISEPKRLSQFTARKKVRRIGHLGPHGGYCRDLGRRGGSFPVPWTRAVLHPPGNPPSSHSGHDDESGQRVDETASPEPVRVLRGTGHAIPSTASCIWQRRSRVGLAVGISRRHALYRSADRCTSSFSLARNSGSKGGPRRRPKLRYLQARHTTRVAEGVLILL
jgi:hypothetical protein